MKMKKTIFISFLLSVLIVVCFCVYAWKQYQSFSAKPMNIPAEGVIFTVKPGMNISRVSQQLTEKGLSDFPSSISIYMHAI
jgi:cell division protein YceG involved in septum cleavage